MRRYPYTSPVNLLASALTPLLVVSCGAPYGSVDAGSDASGSLEAECGSDTEWLYYEYRWGDLQGSSGCVAAALADTRWETPDRSAPARRVSTGYRGDPAVDSTLRGLPSGLCGANVFIQNLPLETGSEGELIDVTEVSGDGYDPAVFVILAYEESTTPGAECDGDLTWARLLSGRWRIRAGGDVGDLVQLEASGVQFEDVLGRPVTFSEMSWQVRVAPPVVYP